MFMGSQNSGKNYNQKMKPLLIYQYLMRNSDEQHVCSVKEIIGFLQENGINAERKSIYRDIKEINKALLSYEQDISIDEASELIEENDFYRTITYDEKKKGYYVSQRNYDEEDIRLLAECIYSAKFINTTRANTLIDVICSLVSDKQGDKIKHQAFLVDRVKTENTRVPIIISKINEAMSNTDHEGNKCSPRKISFAYLRYSIRDVARTAKPQKTKSYKVSPYYLIINDGNYYLLAVPKYGNKVLTFRVDRMTDVEILKEPREGEEVFKSINLANYTKSYFSMFRGEDVRVKMLFDISLLDTVVERFGTSKDVWYIVEDKEHFTLTTTIGVSDQFYAWITGFGNKAKIISPEDIVNKYVSFLKQITSSYE